MEINFTQYMLPNGRPKQVSIDRPVQIAEMAKAIGRAIPGNFACEVLMNGRVSFTYETDDDDIDIELSRNNDDVIRAVDALIARIYKNLPGVTPSQKAGDGALGDVGNK